MADNSQTAIQQRYRDMTETPVGRLVLRLAGPTIISMLVTAVYNMADTVYVGQLGDTSATAAVGLCFPIMAIIQAIGFTFGQGTGNYVSRLLGNKDRDFAGTVAATGFFTALSVSILFSLLGLCFRSPLSTLLGAVPGSVCEQYVGQYLIFVFLGCPFIASSFVINNLLRYQGSSFYAMVGITSGGILNVILDPFFIFDSIFSLPVGLGLGVQGAALATAISQMISFIILMRLCFVGANIHINIKKYVFSLTIIRKILACGLPSFIRQTLASISMTFLNNAAYSAGAASINSPGLLFGMDAAAAGEAAVAAMTIVGRVFQFALSALLGFGQGFQPVSAFNYGAGKYKRVCDAFWFCVKAAALVLILIGVAGEIFAPHIVSLIQGSDPKVIEIGTTALRYYFLVFPFSAFTILCNMLTQTIGKNFSASLLSFSRQGLFLIPLLLVLPTLFGLTGVQLSQPIADFSAFLLAIALTYKTLRELNIKEAQKTADPDIQ